ncbi:hypothetical protein C7H19_15445 [Aphanothece hegewaldii CCALA 016]|uniref:P/Homo B domain-containing protein n=1 Tax=Aphanothece hegewaldii CCALA 016 TaxID=2107694 RepID=A0A2T1LVR2_9CHRO|nr:proprotein convertase P-domain-containing protein [Aphanothece hegewaldii]PSF35818.1 hypothetical protein C7H19_15445 [Aphanothece hegewaldii CCALA 016]
MKAVHICLSFCVSLTIGDYTVTTSNLSVSGISSISDLNVVLNISHSWNSDLRVFVISPTGRQVELFSEAGIGGKGFINTTLDDEVGTSINNGSGTFSGTYKPFGRLSDFDGLNATGIWKLKIIDAAEGDTGKLNSWSLIVNGTPPTGNLTKYGTSGNDTLTGGSSGKFTSRGDE